jgi:two-component system, LytTR family, response regulator
MTSRSPSAPFRRVAIVDDEPVARLGLRRLIERLPSAQLVGEARSGPEAVRLLRDTEVHILFLDVHMPGTDAFELLTRVAPDRVPIIVVVTAFPDYAVRAFDLDVADYLLKPFDAARFLRAWERACTALTHRTVAAQSPALGTRPEAPALSVDAPRHRPLLLRRDGQVHVVALREVDWIEAGHNVVTVHTARGAFEWRQSLHALAQRLGPAGFVRVHRSALVNAAAVAGVKITRTGDGHLTLLRGARVPLSRRYRGALDAVLRHGPPRAAPCATSKSAAS